MFAPDSKQRHAMVDFSGLPKPYATLRATVALDAFQNSVMIAWCRPEVPRHHAGGMPRSIKVRAALPQVEMPTETVDGLAAHAAGAWATCEPWIAKRRWRRAVA